MERDNNKTVTRELQILIPASRENQEGIATFSMAVGTPMLVRSFSNREMTLANLRRHVTPCELKHFIAVISLKQALDIPVDALAVQSALRRLAEAYDMVQTTDAVDKDWGRILAPLIGLPPDESLRYFLGKGPGPMSDLDPHVILSREVSQRVLTSAQIVLWWSKEGFRPALYCEDLKTAFYVRSIFHIATGGRAILICPHCGDPFVQKRSNQDYCLPAHRDAHRVARFRERKRKSIPSKIQPH